MTMLADFEIRREPFVLDFRADLPGHGVTALFGPSGCGKTSVLRAIAGLDRHLRGQFRFGDEIWQDENVFVPTYQRSVGYVFQEASLFTHLNVAENIDYAAKRVVSGQRKISRDDAIELLGVAKLLGRSVKLLSGGERQRVAIARALAASPRLLLMDEPLSALDKASREQIFPYLEMIRDELDIPIIYVSHVLDEVSRLADHLVMVGEGKVQAAGDIRSILTRLDQPLAGVADAESIIEATVVEHDDEFHLTYLDSPAGRFTMTRRDIDLGTSVRLRIAARDISLTLEAQRDTSILNIFPAVIDDIQAAGDAQMTVRLMVNSVPLLARITRKSATMLALKTGMQVFVQAKSIALL